jgi:hypothetical protein
MPRRVFLDEKTGREVWQVTDGEFECVAPYMDVRAWTLDDRYLIFACNRGGTWLPCRLDVEKGEVTELAKVECLFRSVALDPVNGEVYCQDGMQVRAIHVDTLEQRVAVDYALWPHQVHGFSGKGHTPALSSDGKWIASGATDATGRGVILIASTEGPGDFEVVPLSRDDMIADHVLFCPNHPDLLSFAGSPDRQNDPNNCPELRARETRIDRNTGVMAPLVLMPPGFRATHCTWGHSGERMYFHRKKVPEWVPTALCSVNNQGDDLRVHFETSQWRLGHSAASPDEKWIVTDSQDADVNPLVLAATAKDEQHVLCWPNMSQKTSTRPHKRRADLPPHTDVDTHPGWSSTGKFVHYTSDVSGRSQVYVVPVGDLTQPTPARQI